MVDHDVTCSMSRYGNVWDIAAMGELLFNTQDRAHGSQDHLSTRDDAKADVFEYIERFYDPRRRHSTLGYLNPVEFEDATAFA